MKARYLMHFSYLGTRFRGAEKFKLRTDLDLPDPSSIQGVLEIALRRLRPVEHPEVVLSSRTDSGVHAIKNTAHVDLNRESGYLIYRPYDITKLLNRYFYDNDLSIHLSKVLRVSDEFNARFDALSRTYLYRFAVLKSGFEEKAPHLSCLIPIEEWRRCYFIIDPRFEIERLREALHLFVGVHDFTTFKKADKLAIYKHSRRTVISVQLEKGKPAVTSFNDTHRFFDYWDITIKGRGFVHNQIRRIIGALHGVASGRLTNDDIKLMLQVPSKHHWPSYLRVAPPYGLYLCDVEYNPASLEFDESNCQSDKLVMQDSVNVAEEKLS